ncbi:S-layer homology domain-containing protein [Bacillus sp. ISL-41]|uniref:S-layer homology domain-containing protein n=1 Tax=Bacillus sp. ISL-41 TaxID=2819127 RepID=UPI001BEA1136|nr:S-layer homology domain-containing protein [Bacillus sp. ISL-41]MBT2641747.1 S-layer homology domain-containing protein [Bacillus sp. ISL-41]
MAYQPKSYRKFVATAATATLVASAVAPAALAASSFTDVAPKYKEAVDYLFDKGITNGKTEELFGTHDNIKRGELAIWLTRALGLEEAAKEAAPSGFADVAGTYYDGYVSVLKEEGILDGKSSKEFGVNDYLTRGQMAKLLSNAYGLVSEEEAPFEDKGQWAEFIDGLYAYGITQGKTEDTFGSSEYIKRGDIAIFLFRADTLPVEGTPEFDYEGELEIALENGAEFTVPEVTAVDTEDGDIDVTTVITDAEGNELEAIDTKVAGTYTITYTAEDADGNVSELVLTVEVAEAEFVAPAVESVSANNLKEVSVKFNNAVSKADVKTTDFAVKNNTVAAVTLSEDNKTAVLTLTTEVAQQSDVEVTAKKSIKFENGVALEEDVVKTVNVTDVTIPVAESITLTGPNTFEVNFSEPVKAVSPEVLINNGIYGVAERTLSTDGRTLTVKLSASSLTEGSYEVKVSGYSDYANFAAMSKTFTLEYKKDLTAPTVELVSASQSEVVVEFDKAVTQKGGAALTKDFFYHTYSAWKPVAVETTDNKKFTLKFSDSDAATQDFILPEGNVTVTVLKSVGDVPVVDMWGNAVASDTKLEATVSADKVAPTVTKVEAKAENQVVVTFSEKIDIATAKFAIKDSEGKAISQTIATPVAFDNEKLTATLNLSSKLAGGTYTIEVSDAVDTSLSKNKITAVTVPFTVTDKTPIDLASVTAKVVTNEAAKEQYIYVTFPEAVATSGANSALNKDNYLVGGAALATGDKVELFGTDNKRVKITVKYRGETPAAVVTAGTTELTMGRIADAAGNVNAALSTDKVITADTAPTTFTAEAIGLNKLELVFNAELKTVTADGIEVDGSDADTTKTTVAAIDKVEVKDGKTYVTVTVKAEESLANKSTTELDKMSVAIVDNKLETITGQKLTSVTAVAAGSVTDAIAPELESVDPITLARTSDIQAVITVDFDENLDALHTLAATDLVLTDANGKVYVAGTDYTVALNGTDNSKLEVTFTAADKATLDKLNGTKFSVATKTTVNYLDDAAENVIKAFEAKQTKTALTEAPVVTP